MIKTIISTQRLRKEAEDRWPNLQNVLACYLHQDWDVFDETPHKAVDRAISETPLETLKLVTTEWRDWRARSSRAVSLQRQVNEGLCVNVGFKTSMEAREFMNIVYDKLIFAIRNEDEGWKP